MAKRKGERPTTTAGGYVRIVGYLRERDYDRFIAYAEEAGIPQSVLIRISLLEYLKRMGVDSEPDR